ncbi:MAG TPA: gluconeogenesis factor YvcK family protein [Actinomycetota bacterium]|nr:gluconeogenesis factor YvcK family protein [Actinomycetota bacterium]
MSDPRVVGIGGGHGLAVTLSAARLYAGSVDAVVTVADDGGSSGRLTRELGVPPPGDIRNCLVALADNASLGALYQHRFSAGALTGHTVGNLMIAALTEMTGDFALAVEEAGNLLGARGRVFPATTELVELRARVEGGTVVGQVAVARSKRPIQEVYLEPESPAAHPPAVSAIGNAHQIVLGPGSLFTSLIATLLVPGIRDAVIDSAALTVFVCNNRLQKGETEGLTASAHLDALVSHLNGHAPDVVVVQAPVLPSDGVVVDHAALGRLGPRVVEADVSTQSGAHDPVKLAGVLRDLG